MTTRAIGYVRVSSVGQVDGEGLGVQRDKIEAWCRYQGIELVGIETDAGISGADIDNRPGFIDAMRKVLAIGDGVVLVVTKLDRLGRDALDIQEVIASSTPPSASSPSGTASTAPPGWAAQSSRS